MAQPIIDRERGIIIPEVTVDDFVARYGQIEALEVSQLHDPNAVAVDNARIDLALSDAQAWLYSHLLAMEAIGRELVTSSAKRYCCAAARYLLDSLRRRLVVTEEFEELRKELARFASEGNRLSKWRSNGGRSSIRIGHQRSPQYSDRSLSEWRELGEHDGSYENYPVDAQLLAKWQSELSDASSTPQDTTIDQTFNL